MYIPGDPWCVCDRCGFKFRKSQTRKTWDGFVVCKKDWEPRHPQDIGQTPREDKQFVKDARPEPDEVFLDSPSTGEDL